MAAHQFSVSAHIAVPAQTLYSIIADYHQGHPQIIPRPPFISLIVEEGGVGSGTVIQMRTQLMGKLQTIRCVVTEPEPGRVLVETNDNGYSTSFTVDPRDAGKQAYVTITTWMTKGSGVLSALECWFAGRMLRPVYRRELEQLAMVGNVWLTSQQESKSK